MTRDAVIAILKTATEYVSGETISHTLGISRAAVNTAVQSLRREGYIIASSTNKGYRLQHAPDRLTAGDLLALLPAARMQTVRCLDTVDSTNKRLRDMAMQGAPAGQVVLADEQTAGRGRRGRGFSSPKGKGIYLSFLLRPDEAPADATSLTAWTAVAVSRAIESVCGIRPGIKWVNDLVWNQRKLCGILTEMSVESEGGHIQYVVIGIGLNVHEQPADFPPEVQDTATSLLAETGQAYSRAILAAAMIRELDAMSEAWPRQKAAYLEAYCQSCLTVGRDIRVITGNTERTGVATGIDDSFGLCVRYANGETGTVSSGEVSVRGLYGYV